MSTIRVTGGTGMLGQRVVQCLSVEGWAVRVLRVRLRPAAERTPYPWLTGDLRSGEGIDPAVEGVDAITHCASGPRGDVEAARNLLAAA